VILVDTSVWVDHLRAANPALARLLDRGEVLGHPFVVGEIALGDLRQRERILRALLRLPSAAVATHAEVLHFVEARALFARGVGYVDVHLLAAASLTAGARLWTHDKRLHELALGLGLAAIVP
jgi:predicted nucleic acid-binding protein